MEKFLCCDRILEGTDCNPLSNYSVIFLYSRPMPIRCFYTMVEFTTGVHPSDTMMHSPLFQIFPYFLGPTNVQILSKIFKILPFPDKFLDFHPPKFLMTFFSLSLSLSPLQARINPS